MNKPKAQQPYQSDNFFEAFRELGNQTVRTGRDGIADTAMDMVSQIATGTVRHQPLSGELRPNQPIDIEEEILRREEEAVQKERLHFQHVRRQEELVYSRKEEEIKLEMKAVQDELKKLIGEASGLSQEVEIAVEQVVVEPGKYHFNFFHKLRQTLVLLRKKIADSQTWMHSVNSRAQARSFFWSQVGKSGTKYMLSQERYMSTQAG